MSQIPEVETEARLEELRRALGRIGDQNPRPEVQGETKREELRQVFGKIGDQGETKREAVRQALGRIGDQEEIPANEGLVSGNIYQAPKDNTAQAQEVELPVHIFEVAKEFNGTDIELVKESIIVQGMNQPVTIQPGLYLTITPVTAQDFEVYGPLVIKRKDYYLRTTLRDKVSGDLFFQPIDYRVVAYDTEKQKLYLTWEEGMPGR